MACLEITCGKCRKTSFMNERKCQHCGETEQIHASFDEADDYRESGYERDDDGGNDDE